MYNALSVCIVFNFLMTLKGFNVHKCSKCHKHGNVLSQVKNWWKLWHMLKRVCSILDVALLHLLWIYWETKRRKEGLWVVCISSGFSRDLQDSAENWCWSSRLQSPRVWNLRCLHSIQPLPSSASSFAALARWCRWPPLSRWDYKHLIKEFTNHSHKYEDQWLHWTQASLFSIFSVLSSASSSNV